MFNQYINDPKTVTNNANGQSYQVNDKTKFDRLVILGIEAGTYYVSEREMALETIEFVKAYLEKNFIEALERISEISRSGRAIKNDPAIFVLAMAISIAKTTTQREAVRKAFGDIIRTMSHLMMLIGYMKSLKAGWGRFKRAIISRWFDTLDSDELAYQFAKYQSRNGWATRDILELVHPKATTAKTNAVYKWAMDGSVDQNSPRYLIGVERAKKARTVDEIVSITKSFRLARENIPTVWLKEKQVWQALLTSLPFTAMVRNLGVMASNGLLDAMTPESKYIINKLNDAEMIKQSRIHPFSLFLAMKQYDSGHGFRGSKTWSANPAITKAVEKAITLAYGNVTPTNKTIMLACDVSGSMAGSYISGTNVSAIEAEAMLVNIINQTEPNVYTYTFTTTFREYRPSGSYSGVLNDFVHMQMGGTDCSLPVSYALRNKLNVDAFIIITDSETWANKNDMDTLLKQYRKTINSKAKFIVLGMTATNVTVASPNDPLSLDICGMDASVPLLISEFIND
jgi:60 kDa SS-A/Ro ribonucleoprotein